MKKALFLLPGLLLTGHAMAMSCLKYYDSNTFVDANYATDTPGQIGTIACNYESGGAPAGGYIAGPKGTLIPSSANWVGSSTDRTCTKYEHPEFCTFQSANKKL